MMNIHFILFVFFISLCWTLVTYEQSFASGNIYHIDPNNGNDMKPGSLSNPWRTIRKSIPKLQPGDTLYLRGGTYFETEIKINVSGTESNRIAIKNYPDELPVIDGGYRDFRIIPNSDWQMYDPTKKIYRSVNTYLSAEKVYGYFSNENNNYRLVPYKNYGDFSTDNENYTKDGDIYIGPGIFWNSNDAKIYIRLQPSKQEISMGYNIPSNKNPGLSSITIMPSVVGVTFTKGSSYIDIAGINLQYHSNAIRIGSGSHNISVRNCVFKNGMSDIVISNDVHALFFGNNVFRGYVPPWIAFSDVKSTTKPGELFAVAGIVVSDSSANIKVMNCLFENTWDGLDVNHSSNIRIHHNTFQGTRDDVIQLGSACYDVEIDHNQMVHVSKGVSRHGSGSSLKPGTKYIHHNIIDCSKLMLGGRRDPNNLLDSKYHGPNGDGMVWASPFGSHTGKGYGRGDPWKIYNNTVIFGKELNGRGAGCEYVFESFYPNNPQEVYNNIFIQTMDHCLARAIRLEDGSQIHDGNIYFRKVANPKEYFFGLWQDKRYSRNFKSLAEFKSSPYFHVTKKHYSPGFENSGIEADPQLDAEYRPSSNSLAANGAVPLPSHWPGQDGEKYRGALPAKNLHRK